MTTEKIMDLQPHHTAGPTLDSVGKGVGILAGMLALWKTKRPLLLAGKWVIGWFAMPFRMEQLAEGQSAMAKDVVESAAAIKSGRTVIEELKQSHRALHASQSRMKRALAIQEERDRRIWLDCSHPRFVMDPEGHILEVNEALVRFWGHSARNLLGVGWINTLVNDDRERITDMLQTCIESTVPSIFRAQFRVNAEEGAEIWLTMQARPLFVGPEIIELSGEVQSHINQSEPRLMDRGQDYRR